MIERKGEEKTGEALLLNRLDAGSTRTNMGTVASKESARANRGRTMTTRAGAKANRASTKAH